MARSRKEREMLHSRLTQLAYRWFLTNKELQAYNDTQEDSGFEDFAVDLICSIAMYEHWHESENFYSMEEYADYVADWFDFDLITAEEIIKEYEREDR